MNPWHTNHPNEKILDTCSSTAYQLRTRNSKVNIPPNHFYSAPYASDFTYLTPNTAYPRKNFYNACFCSCCRGGGSRVGGTGTRNAGEGATSSRHRPLGRYTVQGGRLCDKQQNDTHIYRRGQGNFFGNSKAISLGDRADERRTTARSN